MKYGIIGTGAIGGYYGAKLAYAGKEIHFLLHSDYEYVKEHGLQLNSPDGSFHLTHVNAYQDVAEMPQCDVVLVALKSVGEDMLKELLPPIVKPDTLVVLIQNGIGLESDVAAMLPGVQLAAGLAFICSAKTKPGVVDHQELGMINIADFNCKDQRIIEKLLADFTESGIQARQVEYHEARWKKAVWNMPFNGLTVVLETTTDKLLAHPATEGLVRDLMREVIDAARACGVKNLTYEHADQMISMTKSMSPYSPSMKLDYDFRRPMEVKYLYSRPIEEALKHGYEMKKLKMLEAELLFKEKMMIDNS
ncbi:MAG: 2-dehydropantoate 2-reductase [Prevotella sp.]|nr:2-dehydropantoate 2-reductase [Prevotella sp.]